MVIHVRQLHRQIGVYSSVLRVRSVALMSTTSQIASVSRLQKGCVRFKVAHVLESVSHLLGAL